jgi:enoyl-CoA hydratase/carnithine racemase
MAESTATAAKGLEISRDGPVVRLTLNRPEKRNALSRDLLGELARAQKGLASDRECRVVIVTANGPVFSSGHDLSEMTGRSQSEYHDVFALCSKVMYGFRQLPQPVIARVQGMATAAGCQLVAACDLAVAAENATFATPGVKIGLFCTTPMVPLVRAIAPKAAMEMLLTGKPISAGRACELGLINRVVEAGGLDAAIGDWVNAILSSSPSTIRLGKRAFYDQLSLDERTAYERATAVMTENALDQDSQEGISAFLNKRRPHWQGT